MRAYARTRISRISKLKYIIVSLCLYFSGFGLGGVGGCGFWFFLGGAARQRGSGAVEMQIVLTSVCLELVNLTSCIFLWVVLIFCWGIVFVFVGYLALYTIIRARARAPGPYRHSTHDDMPDDMSILHRSACVVRVGSNSSSVKIEDALDGLALPLRHDTHAESRGSRMVVYLD